MLTKELLNALLTSGGQSTQIKYLSKSSDTYNKILLYNFTRVKVQKYAIFFMYLSKKVLIDLFCNFI